MSMTHIDILMTTIELDFIVPEMSFGERRKEREKKRQREKKTDKIKWNLPV